MLRWYACSIATEATAVAHLSKQGFRLFMPMMEVKERRPRIGLETVLRNRFPGYGFLEIDIDQERWRAINGTQGVRHLLPRSCEQPMPLPIGFVEALQLAPVLTAYVADQIVTTYYSQDALVRFIAGPLAAYDARVVDQDGVRIRARLRSGALVHTHSDRIVAVDAG